MLTNLLSVALGGALGASARYLSNVTLTRTLGSGFPYGTIAVNIIGSFIMGAIVVLLERKGLNAWAPFLMTGVLGGFTTFSAFSLDTLTLIERGDIGTASLYVGLSVGLSLAAITAGLMLARLVVVTP